MAPSQSAAVSPDREMSDPVRSFTPLINHFTASTLASFDAKLVQFSSHLTSAETESIRSAACDALRTNARLKLNRVLLLELHAAKRAGELDAEDEAARFIQFVERSLQRDFIDHLDARYPPLRARLQRAMDQQRLAIESLIDRFVRDRRRFSELLGQGGGRLVSVAMGQGDLHEAGQAVARLSLEGGVVMYKPRSLRVDAQLDWFLSQVFGDAADRIRVPRVLACGEYGWATFVTHSYCENEQELQLFYRRLGHWLAVLRLLGGTDIHQENLIASGPVPIAVDVESLFILPPGSPSSGYGDAFDKAQNIISGSVLRTGIVPVRTPTLGFKDVDVSAAGALLGQQPQVQAPIIVDEGTTRARLQVVEVEVSTAQNHPSLSPDVSRFWDEISTGFLEITARLRCIDAKGDLVPMLLEFQGCRVREIRRMTQAYLEIGRMLWHPASLHDEAKAIERARDLLVRHAAVAPGAPSDEAEIAKEIDDLRHGDIPTFVSSLDHARIDAVVADWRQMRADIEEMTIRSALLATDINLRVRYRQEERSGFYYLARHPHADNLDARRRKVAADAVKHLLRLSIREGDDTVTWITTEVRQVGWVVQPLEPDLYYGLGGVIIALAGYLHETEQNRANLVEGVESAYRGAVLVMQAMQSAGIEEKVGGFAGYGSHIWTWLTLYELQGVPEFLARAIERAEALEQFGFAVDERYDLLDGAAGAIVPLLNLADVTGDPRWQRLAGRAANRLEETAILDEQGARWKRGAQEPIGGFAHGAAGMAWALKRLVLSGAGEPGDLERWDKLADAAFLFQESLYDESVGSWLDIRSKESVESFPIWCHGGVGIGMVAGDLYFRTGNLRYLRTLRRAFAHASGRWGASHTLCHGDISLWEFLRQASLLDPQVCENDLNEGVAQIVSAIEEHHGMVSGLTRAAFTPGLMTGMSGVIHGLCRMHPECDLASPLLLGRRSGARPR